MRQNIQPLCPTVPLVHSRHSVDVRVQMTIQIRCHSLSAQRLQYLAVKFVSLRGEEAVLQHTFYPQILAIEHTVLTVEANENGSVFRLEVTRVQESHVECIGVSIERRNNEVSVLIDRCIEHDEQIIGRMLVSVGVEIVFSQLYHIISVVLFS